jgi:hypothetical protein
MLCRADYLRQLDRQRIDRVARKQAIKHEPQELRASTKNVKVVEVSRIDDDPRHIHSRPIPEMDIADVNEVHVGKGRFGSF